MAYIYKISNDINNKVYIGKTTGTIEYRWKQHCNDRMSSRCSHRHLYAAMNKYGLEHFTIEVIEEIKDINILAEREQYWINYYDSYNNGYNETLGGDGKIRIDYDQVIELYNQIGTCKGVAKTLNIDAGHVSTILKSQGINVAPHGLFAKKRNKPIRTKAAQLQELAKINSVAIDAYDLNHNFVQSFNSIKEASLWCLEHGYSNSTRIESVRVNISRCLAGKIRYSAKHIWKYHKDTDSNHN